MTYDENVFKEKANRKARKIWIVFAVLLSANYGSDASGGLYPTTSYLIFLALCWLPLIFGEVLLRVKGWATELYRYDLVIGCADTIQNSSPERIVLIVQECLQLLQLIVGEAILRRHFLRSLMADSDIQVNLCHFNCFFDDVAISII